MTVYLVAKVDCSEQRCVLQRLGKKCDGASGLAGLRTPSLPCAVMMMAGIRMPSCCKCSSSSRPRQTRGRSLVDRPRRRKGFCVKRAYAQQPGQGFLHARVVVNNGDPTGSLYHRLKIIVTGEIAIEVDLGPMATS